MKPNQPVPEVTVGGGEGEQCDNIDDCGSGNDALGAGQDECKQHDDPPANTQSPLSGDRTPTANLDSKDNRNLWERLMQARGKKLITGSLYSITRPANAPNPTPRQPWHWNSSIFPVRSSTPRVNVAACRDEDRYGITPESDAEAAAAMQRTNDDVADISTQPGRPAVGVQVSPGRPTQTQASTSGPEEIGVSCCGFVFICRRRPD
ncbi:hypothetical protein EDB19DRAFT_1113870 [Suillus lakei]|nr:hypothetical protein EDB19DRAFT_1113870 [Suillus lakei]